MDTAGTGKVVRRRPNFTADEVELLLASVERNTKVNMQVENKRCEFTPNGLSKTGRNSNYQLCSVSLYTVGNCCSI